MSPLQGTVAPKDKGERQQYVEASLPILYGGAMPTTLLGTVQFNEMVFDDNGAQQVTVGVSCNSHQKPGGAQNNAWSNVYFRQSSNVLSQETKGQDKTNAMLLNLNLRPGTPVAICFLPAVGEDGRPRQYTKKENVNGSEVTAVYSDFGGYVRILWLSVIGNQAQVDAAVAAFEAAQAEREAQRENPAAPAKNQSNWAATQQAMQNPPVAPAPAPAATTEPAVAVDGVVTPPPASPSPNRWRQGN